MSETRSLAASPDLSVRAGRPAEDRNRAASAIRNIWVTALLVAIPAATYYGFLLCLGAKGFFDALPHGLVFNSMAQHFVQGRFDVDPASIGDEGFLRDGAVYAYFGILPALLRVPLLSLANFATMDFTRLGCLCAVTLMALFKALSVLVVARRSTPSMNFLTVLLLAAVLVGGAQVQFLRPSIFQEASLWANACAAGFIYLFVLGWARRDGFSRAVLLGMAVAAGLCLLARVSTGLGLYLAFGFLWLRLLYEAWRAGELGASWATFAVPMAVICVFAGATGIVNAERWGNPLVFADLSRQLIALTRSPDRLVRLHEYGEFNPIRLVYALGYYFVPVWALPDGAGGMPWAEFRDRVFDFVELPPGSFFVSDPLLVGLASYGIACLLRRQDGLRPGVVVPVLGGLAVPPLLILMALALAFRYRLEFYPFLELAALIGFARLVVSEGRRVRTWCAAGAMVSVVAAHAMWVLTMLSPFGPVQNMIGTQSVGAFYRSLF